MSSADLMTEIQITSTSIAMKAIVDCLEKSLSKLLYDTRIKTTGLGIEMEPTVLVATVSAVSSTCTALISGLIQLLKEKKSKGSIKITFKDGRIIEVPAGTSMNEIKELASLACESDCTIKKVHILSDN